MSPLRQPLKGCTNNCHRLLNAPIDSDTVIETAARFAEQLQANRFDLPLDDEQRQGLIDFCQRSTLSTKLERELGVQPRSLRRIDYQQARFESWHPLGLVVHVTPGNAPLLAFCAVVESLLAGNINWLRPSSSDEGLTARLLAALVQCDTSEHAGRFHCGAACQHSTDPSTLRSRRWRVGLGRRTGA